MTAPVASGWSRRRVGLAPTGKRRLSTAHTHRGHSHRISASPKRLILLCLGGVANILISAMAGLLTVRRAVL
jgi:hypothetical protein